MHHRDRRGEGARRHAARRRVRDRVRGADRRRRGAEHRAGRARARRCSCSGSAASASRSCRAPASPARARIIASDPRRLAARGRAAARRDRPCSTPAPTTSSPRARDLTGVGADYAFECAGVAALADGRDRGDPPGRHDRAGRRAARRPGDHARPAVLFGIEREAAASAACSGAATRCATSPAWSALWRAGQLDLEGLITAPPAARRDQRGASPTSTPASASAPSSSSEPARRGPSLRDAGPVGRHELRSRVRPTTN